MAIYKSINDKIYLWKAHQFMVLDDVPDQRHQLPRVWQWQLRCPIWISNCPFVNMTSTVLLEIFRSRSPSHSISYFRNVNFNIWYLLMLLLTFLLLENVGLKQNKTNGMLVLYFCGKMWMKVVFYDYYPVQGELLF